MSAFVSCLRTFSGPVISSGSLCPFNSSSRISLEKALLSPLSSITVYTELFTGLLFPVNPDKYLTEICISVEM